MDSFQKKMWWGFVVIVLFFLLLLWIVMMSLEAQFGDCQGLKGVVDKIWTGQECSTDAL